MTGEGGGCPRQEDAQGAFLPGFPRFIHKQAQIFKNQQTFEAIILTLLGAWLIWVSF